MKNVLKGIKHMLNPNGYLVLLGFIMIFILTSYVFLLGHKNDPFSYFCYIASAYFLLINCIWVGKKVKTQVDKVIEKNHYLKMVKNDVHYRTKATLITSSLINLLYAISNFIIGIYFGSVWSITFSIYYFLLVTMRYVLLSSIQFNQFGKNLELEYKRYRICGIIFLLMNIFLTIMVLLILNKSKQITDAGYFIYVMVIYTFYIVINSVVNFIKYRKHQSPMIASAKAISFVTSLISLLSLEVVMLHQFGSPDEFLFNKIMIGTTGAVISLIMTALSLYMIMKSSNYLNSKKASKNL